MTVPGETEAGSAGMQPCRGITWRAHRDDDRSAEVPLPRSSKNQIGSVDPDALKIPARRAECSLTQNARSPFHAEPGHSGIRRNQPCAMRRDWKLRNEPVQVLLGNVVTGPVQAYHFHQCSVFEKSPVTCSFLQICRRTRVAEHDPNRLGIRSDLPLQRAEPSTNAHTSDRIV
jgi:hypothetical protein